MLAVGPSLAIGVPPNWADRSRWANKAVGVIFDWPTATVGPTWAVGQSRDTWPSVLGRDGVGPTQTA
jgi:hypothetical protein